MEGLLGLTNNIKTTEAANRDLSIIERMEGRVQQDRQAEVAAQKEQQLMYEKMYARSDQMLEKDRNKINKRISMAQDQIFSHMKDAGGSNKRFLEQGGLSVTNTITNDIMRSPEAVGYEENKKNLAKILEAKEKGLGHLISPRDMKSLEAYNKNPNGGEITFSGMMSEIEIPPSENFDYDTEIGLEYILSNKSNMMRIKSNYAMTYPDKDPPTYGEIFAFAKEMGYGGTGSNQTKMKALAAEKLAAAKRAAANPPKPTKEETFKNSFIGQISAVTSLVIDQGVSVRDLNNKEKYPDGYINQKRKEHASINKVLKDKNTLTSRERKLSEKGFDRTDITGYFKGFGSGGDNASSILDDIFSEKYGLKESFAVLPENTGNIVSRIFGKSDDNPGMGYEIADGKILNFLPDDKMYQMKGLKLGDQGSLEDNSANRGDYIIEGMYSAFKGKSKGEDILYMNAYNDDGKTFDEDTQKTINEGYEGDNGGGEAKPTYVIALRNQDSDDLYYREVDITDPYIQNVMKNSMPKDDDVTDVVSQDNRTNLLHNNIEKMKDEEEIQMRGTLNALEQGIFQEAIFEQEGEQYYGAGSAGSQNRYPMMKSYYTALNAVLNEQSGKPGVNENGIKTSMYREDFTTSMELGGVTEDLSNYDKNPYVIATSWLHNVNDESVSSMGKKRNTAIAQKWMQLMQLQENM